MLLAMVYKGLLTPVFGLATLLGQTADTPGTLKRPYSSTLVRIISGTNFIDVEPRVTWYPYFLSL